MFLDPNQLLLLLRCGGQCCMKNVSTMGRWGSLAWCPKCCNIPHLTQSNYEMLTEPFYIVKIVWADLCTSKLWNSVWSFCFTIYLWKWIIKINWAVSRTAQIYFAIYYQPTIVNVVENFSVSLQFWHVHCICITMNLELFTMCI